MRKGVGGGVGLVVFTTFALLIAIAPAAGAAPGEGPEVTVQPTGGPNRPSAAPAPPQPAPPATTQPAPPATSGATAPPPPVAAPPPSAPPPLVPASSPPPAWGGAPPPAWGAPPPPAWGAPTAIGQSPGWHPPPPPLVEESPPTFLTTDRMDGTTRVGAQFGFDKFDTPPLDDALFMRLDLYGQLVLPNSQVGIYGEIPFSYASFSSSLSDLTGTDGGSGHGNLSLGVFFRPIGTDQLILRSGLIMATASTDLAGGLGILQTSYERVTDIFMAAPNTTTLRLSASTVQRQGNLFFRGDFGFDLIIDRDGSSDQDIFGRLNLAAGVRLPVMDLSFELATIGVLDGPDPGNITDRFVHTGAVALHTRGENQFHAGLVMPLDDALRGDLWIVSLGFQHAM